MTDRCTAITPRGKLSRFTAEDVDAMEREKKAGMTYRELAAKYATSTSNIRILICGIGGPRYWAAARLRTKPSPPANPPAPKTYDIAGLKARGYTLTQIAAITRRPYREVDSA